MSLLTVGLIALIAWSVFFVVVLAMCRASARADAASERMNSAQLAQQRSVAPAQRLSRAS